MDYAIELGLDTDPEKFLLIQPDDGVQALDIYLKFVESGYCSLVILDSVAAITTKQEISGEVGDQHIGVLARLMSQTLKPIVNAAKQTNTACIFINQIRDSIGFGASSTTPGGKALKFYTSLRMEIKRIGLITKSEKNIGQEMRFNLVKNRFGYPYQKTDVNFYYGIGVKKGDEAIEVGLARNILQRGGAYYTFPLANGETLRLMGKQAVMDYYAQNPVDFANLLELVNKTFEKKVIEDSSEDDSEEDFLGENDD